MDSCESNWTIRDSNDVESFSILHNGFLKVDEQKITIKITTESGRILEKVFELKSLNPYEIFEVVPQSIFNNLDSWLDNEQANCSIKFKINGGFTRTLVGNRTKSRSDMLLIQTLHITISKPILLILNKGICLTLILMSKKDK